MPDTPREIIGFKELAELLIRERGIHEGHWGIFVRFALSAANVNVEPADGSASTRLAPTALVPIVELGIQKYAEPLEFTVDAAEVNPAPKGAKKGASKKGAK